VCVPMFVGVVVVGTHHETQSQMHFAYIYITLLIKHKT
jgi:hypothetical protein